MDKKKLYIGIGIALFILVATFISYSFSNQETQKINAVKLDKNSLIYFYGSTCLHCIELSKFLEDSGINKKVAYQKLEVFSNPTNQELMNQAGLDCKLDTTQGMGVPFIYDKGKCYIGTPDAEKFFQEKANQATSSRKSK